MATQTIEFLAPTGQTITARLYAPQSDSIVQTASAVVEATNRKGLYSATFTDVAAGSYDLFASGTFGIAVRYVTLTFTTATFSATDFPSGVVRADLGMAAADLDSQLDAILSSVGTGARTVTVTVNDGTSVLEGARVRFTEGADSFTGTTNSSGQVTFNLDDATYAVAVTKSGFTFAGTSQAISGDASVTYSMTQVSITPSDDPSQATGYITVRDEELVAEADIDVKFRMTSIPDSEGILFDRAWFTVTSDDDGLVQASFLVGAIYDMKIADCESVNFLVPESTSGSFAIESALLHRGSS